MSRAEEFTWPKPHPTDQLGVVALDYLLTPERLLSAYRHGIFPWPDGTPGHPIPWVCPPRRAILEFSALHVPRNLRKAQRHATEMRYTTDTAFPAVIASCAATPRPGQDGTWITPPMLAAYVELHRRGHAHSIEVWQGETLVGGLYGVTAGGVFTGESMFHRIDNASKLAVLFLIEHLRMRGASWMDIQQLTPHFALLGAREVPRATFLTMLREEQNAQRDLFPPHMPITPR